jgi:hypothetical protein
MNVKILSLFLLQTVLASLSSKEEQIDSQDGKVLDLGQYPNLSSGEGSGSNFKDFVDGGGARPVFFSEAALKTDGSFWFRGDKREPSNIYKDGFRARGNNTSLIEHVHGNGSGRMQPLDIPKILLVEATFILLIPRKQEWMLIRR